MNPGDVLIIFDIRRYEQEMVSLADGRPQQRRRDHRLHRPVGVARAKHARHTFRVQIEAPSAWDSSVVTLFIVEALIEAVQKLDLGRDAASA